MKLITQFNSTFDQVRIHQDTDTKEYRVRLYSSENGFFFNAIRDCDCFTDNLTDAQITGEYMLRDAREKRKPS